MVRHGHTEWQRSLFLSLSEYQRFSDSYDIASLSDRGRAIAYVLAERLPAALVLSSDLPRAVETAELLGRGIRMVVKNPLFREVPLPRISGHLFSYLQVPAIVWSVVHRLFWVLGIGECREGPRASWQRAAAAAAAKYILDYLSLEKAIILVSHGWFMILLALYLRWRGLIEQGPLFPQVGYCAVTEYRLRPLQTGVG